MPVLDTPNVSFSTALTARRSFATTTLPLDEIRAVMGEVREATTPQAPSPA